MWPALTIVAFVALAFTVALHFWWRSKVRRELGTWRAEIASLRSREQTAAAEARARQDTIFDSMPQGVLVLDESDRVQFANRAFSQLFDAPGDLRGKTLLEALRRHEVAELVGRAASEGRVLGHEMRLSGGEERWLQVNAAAITGQDNQRRGMILVFHDLTRLKRLERTREEFVANVSHELRTPLSLIKGYAETLLDGAKDNPEVALQFLQTIDRNAERLKLLIEDLLTISELESGRLKLNLQVVALHPVVDKVIDDLKVRAGSKNMN